MFTVILGPVCSFVSVRHMFVCVCSQEVLLHPYGLLLLLHYALFDDTDQVIDPCPGLRLNAGIEARNDLQLFLFSPTQSHQLLLRLHAKRQLPVWTGNRKEAVLWWLVWCCLEPSVSDEFL